MGELAELKKVVSLFQLFDWLGVNRTNLLTGKIALAINQVSLGLVFLTTNAVITLVRALINESGVV